MSTDLETVTGLLTPFYERYGFTAEPGEKDGDVIVRSDGDDARWVLRQCAATLREAGIRVTHAGEAEPVTAHLWPYDAVRDDPLTELRIPVVRSAWPWWKYEMCVVIDDPAAGTPQFDLPALRPDERETAMLLAELDYKMGWYNDGWKAQMRKKPLDVDAGTNTVILQKVAEGDWRYRRMTFQHGLWPLYNMEQRFTLEELLDHVNGHGDSPNPRWEVVKAAHPEAFGAEAKR